MSPDFGEHQKSLRPLRFSESWPCMKYCGGYESISYLLHCWRL